MTDPSLFCFKQITEEMVSASALHWASNFSRPSQGQIMNTQIPKSEKANIQFKYASHWKHTSTNKVFLFSSKEALHLVVHLSLVLRATSPVPHTCEPPVQDTWWPEVGCAGLSVSYSVAFTTCLPIYTKMSILIQHCPVSLPVRNAAINIHLLFTW